MLQDEFCFPGKRRKEKEGFVLVGIGDSGKTELAMRFADRNRNYFKAIFWLYGSHMTSMMNDLYLFSNWLGKTNRTGLIFIAR
jgi:hypothetical protein